MKQYPEFHKKYPKLIINWVERQNWYEFTEIQKNAIKQIPIDNKIKLKDYILSSETSSGKTEAVYLPLIARIIKRKNYKVFGFNILYISPLKALINDQYNRLNNITKNFKLSLARWHSGVNKKEKKKDISATDGIMLTTPESLEGFLLRSNQTDPEINRLKSIDAVILDEFHSYFDNARGRHLQSLLARLEEKARRTIPRIALSATLGGATSAAKQILRPFYKDEPIVIGSGGKEKNPTKITLKVYQKLDDKTKNKKTQNIYDTMIKQIGKDFRNLDRGLIFTNSRAGVETLYEKLNRLYNHSAKNSNITKFARHYSNLKSKEKNDVEKLMRGDDVNKKYNKMTTVCTSTLELGIDIGKVTRVGQIDSTFSVASLKQRIGRSGRRMNTPEGIVYVFEKDKGENDHPLDALQLRTFQAAATINLALTGQFETPNIKDLHLSTLVHQILSLIHLKTIIGTEETYSLLVKAGPWDQNIIDLRFFKRFLESLTEGKYSLIQKKEKDKWSFPPPKEEGIYRRPVYAVFKTPPQYSVVYHNVIIGQLPMTIQYRSGDTFILNRGRWRVVVVNEKNRRLVVTRVPHANAPRFGGSAQAPSGIIVRQMYDLYRNKNNYLGVAEENTEKSMDEGRKAFKKYNLESQKLLPHGNDILIFPFCGAKSMQTLLLLLRREGLRASTYSFAINVEETTKEEIKDCLKRIKKEIHGLELEELARESLQLCSDRYDHYLSPYHQRLAFSRRYLDKKGITELIDTIN